MDRGRAERRRNRRLGRASGSTGLSLLPFLDVVFATIGIFLLIFAIQVLARVPEIRHPAPAAIVVCADANRLVYFASPDTEPTTFERWQASELVALIADQAAGVANVLLAVGGECGARRHFEDAFRDAAARLADDPDGARPLLRLTQVPLSSAEDAIATLIVRWGAGE